MKTKRTWTPEEDTELRLLCARGFTNEEIAERLGRSYSAVAYRRQLIYCHPGGLRLTDTQIKEIITRYYQYEQPMMIIAREMGLCYSTVRKYVNNHWRKKL